MPGNSTASVVLDTSVVVKSILEPPRRLPSHVYDREVESRGKIDVILEVLERKGTTVYFPRAGLVEVAAALKRGGLDGKTIAGVIGSVEETFIIVSEDVIYSKALEVAIKRAPSGFDTYFIALAALTDSLLITDDKPMAGHAEALGIEAILVREASLEEIRVKLAEQSK